MDAKESQTFDAAIRLLKSKLRHYVYEQRQDVSSSWSRMLILERAILAEAETGWKDALTKWDMADLREMFRLTQLTSMASHRSLLEVESMFAEYADIPVLNMLEEYGKQVGCNTLLGGG